MKLSPRDQDVTLARLGRRIGWRIPTWTQGASGIVSLKAERNGRPVLLIKTSGVRLDRMTPDQGSMVVDTERFLAGFDLTQKASGKGQSPQVNALYVEALMKSVTAGGDPGNDGRPDIDAGLHMSLATPMVAQFPSLPAVLIGHHLQQDKRLKSWLEHETRGEVAFLPPMMPGRDLALETHAHRHAKVLIVANHGVILALENIREIALWEKIERSFLKKHEYLDVLDVWDGGHRQNLLETVKKPPIPLKFYLPDAATLADDLQKSLVVSMGDDGEKLYTLHSNRQDLIELWSAQQILFTACPQLASLPHSMVTKMRKVPAEPWHTTKSAS